MNSLSVRVASIFPRRVTRCLEAFAIPEGWRPAARNTLFIRSEIYYGIARRERSQMITTMLASPNGYRY